VLRSPRLAPANPRAIQPFSEHFPGFATASSNDAAEQVEPFKQLGEYPLPARLMPVPCNRPADAIAVIGGVATETDGTEISATLRSWEDRFHAVAVTVEPSMVTLSVDAPPIDHDQALRLAADHWAFCAPADAGRPGALPQMAATRARRPDHRQHPRKQPPANTVLSALGPGSRRNQPSEACGADDCTAGKARAAGANCPARRTADQAVIWL
jgi:Domain of unknown function (DUF4253)